MRLMPKKKKRTKIKRIGGIIRIVEPPTWKKFSDYYGSQKELRRVSEIKSGKVEFKGLIKKKRKRKK